MPSPDELAKVSRKDGGSDLLPIRLHAWSNISDDDAEFVASSLHFGGDLADAIELLNVFVPHPVSDRHAPLGEWHAALIRDGDICVHARAYVTCVPRDCADLATADYAIVAFYV